MYTSGHEGIRVLVPLCSMTSHYMNAGNCTSGPVDVFVHVKIFRKRVCAASVVHISNLAYEI